MNTIVSNFITVFLGIIITVGLVGLLDKYKNKRIIINDNEYVCVKVDIINNIPTCMTYDLKKTENPSQ